MIIKSFLQRGISNKLDGTEDEFLYEDGLHDATLELDDSDDYTADIEMVDGTHELLFPSEVEDDMPDETIEVINPSDDEEDDKRFRRNLCL